MQNEILINATAGETRVAILEKGQFVEFHIERSNQRSVAGSVVKGRVTRVLPGMQAAFVDIGLEKAAFLYAGDYIEETSGSGDGEEEKPRPRRGRNGNGRTGQLKIEELVREGQEVVVQIAKEPIGSKGARITSHVSIAGRHLVLTPWGQRVGVSRRIGSDRERRRLREIVDRMRPPDLGFIIRTAGEGIREADLEADIRYLTSVWDEIEIRKEEVRAPAVLHSELSLPLRVIRDFANSETKRIVIDAPAIYEEMKSFVSRFVADPKPRIERYQGKDALFAHYGAEVQIDQNLGRRVWLKSGGYLIVDQSEALTAIDVNTGRYVGKRDLEETVLKTNLEAVKEIVQQLRFRNIGGLIILDLIDMESGENREKVYRALQDAIRQDKQKTNILKISELGLVEMTRKRTRENLVQTLCEPCSYCGSRGYILSSESVAYKVLRAIRSDLPRFAGRNLVVTVSRSVAEYLLGPERRALHELETELGREIELRARADLHQEQFEITASDQAGPIELEIPWLRERRIETKTDGTTAKERGDEGDAKEEEATAAPVFVPEAIPKPESPVDIPAGQKTSEGTETAPEEASGEERADPSSEIPAQAQALAEETPPAPQPVDEEAESRILPTSEKEGS